MNFSMKVMSITAHFNLLFLNILVITTWWTEGVRHMQYDTEPVNIGQWLRCCATNRKVAGSIPDAVIGIFH